MIMATSVPATFTTNGSLFTTEDVEKLIGEIKDEGTWTHLKRQSTDKVKIWKKNTKSNTLKARMIFPRISPAKIVEHIIDVDLRSLWDKQFSRMDVLEEKTNEKIVYFVAKTPLIVKKCDFVHSMTHGVTDDLPNTTYILLKDTTHSRAPITSEAERGRVTLGGYLVYPWQGGPESSCVDMYMDMKVNMRGIAEPIITQHYIDGIVTWHQRLTKYILS